MKHAWTCACCGKQHNELPLNFAYKAPDHWFGVPAAERDRRTRLDSDVCVIDDTDIFIRSCIEIPIIGREENFAWGVWISVSGRSYARIKELWDVPVITSEPPLFGWLCNTIAIYPPTDGLKTEMHLQGAGLRPLVMLEPTDHPLAIEQRQGISLARVEEIATALLRH